MPSLPLLRAIGLNFSPNQLETPPGSLVEASNVIIRRDNVIESRRGYALYGTAMGTTTDRCKQLLSYKNKLVRHFSNRLQYESGINNAGDAAFFDFDEIVNGVTQQAQITEAQTGLRIKSIEANSNLYLTTSEGVKKVSAKSANTFGASPVTKAGGIKALDTQAFLNVTLGDQSNFLPSDSGVAYKIVWGTKDANGNLILGVPSDPVTVINPLLDLTLKDFSNFLLQMDNAVYAGSTLFSDTNYYSTLTLPITATSVQLRTNLIALAEKLDKDLLFATDTGAGTAYQPLNISGATVSSGTVTVNFSAGTATNYFIAGDKVNLQGFNSNGVSVDSINTNQVLTSSAAGNIQFIAKNYQTTNFTGISGTITNIPTVAAQGTGTCTITSSGHGLKNLQKIAITGSNSVPNVNGNYIITYLSENTFSIDLKQTFTVANGSQDITCTNHGYVAGDTVSFSKNLGSPTVVTAGTTYYVLAAGLATNTFRISATAGGAAITFNAVDTGSVAKIITSAGNAATWNVLIDGITTAQIESYEFRSIEQPVEQSIPATNAQLNSIQTYFSSIVSTLQEFISARGANIMSVANFATYLESISATTAASVILKITIPSQILQYTSVNNPYFYQIYRTSIATVSGVSSISDISIIQEYTQIEEQFPTSSEFSSGIVVYNDTTPESIAGTGANLYTNERTGEGGLQANDIPPFCTDINTFKGYTFFSNTRTRQRKLTTLIGVVNMINNFNISNPYKLTFSDGTNTNSFTFVTGKKEITRLVCAAGATLAAAGVANYFSINSANNETQYYVWYKVGTSTDPAISGKTGISVSVSAGDLAATVASKTKAAISNILDDFTADTSDLSVSITTISISPTNTFNAVGHSLVNGDIVKFSSTGELPQITNEGDLSGYYYVVNSLANTFQIATTSGGTALSLSYAGTGIVQAHRIISTGGTVLIENNEVGDCTNSTIGTMPVGFSISTQQDGRGENASQNQVLLSPASSVGTAIEETAKSLVRVINQKSTNFINAFYVSGTNSTPGTILFEGKTFSLDEIYVLGSNFIIGESFNPDLSPGTVSITGISLANPTVITTAAPHGLLNGDTIIISNSNSTPIIDGVRQITYLNATSFSVPVNVTIPGTTAVFKSTNSAESSSNEEQPHRVYYSKFQQPEAVPIANYLDVGATDKAILRIFPLRDSLFVFKEDGLYRISGEIAPFSVARFDSSCILIAPDSVSVANNQVYGWTTQGVSTVTEAGVNIISRPIDTEILKKASSAYTNFKTATWGVGYESDNSYTVYTVETPEDDKGTIGFRYSNLTNSWTTVDKIVTCGIVNPADDKLYMGAGDTNYLEKERKDFNRYDYADRELDYSILDNAISGKDLNLSSGITSLSIGDVVVQNQTLTVYEFNMLLKKLDIDVGVPSSDYYSTLVAQAGNNMRTKLVALANKLDSELTPGYLALINSQSGTISTASIADPTVITTTAPHGLQTGRIVTISGNTESDVNGTFQVTVTSPTTFTIPVDLLILGTGGNFSTNDSSFTDLKDCYNAIIAKLNADPIPAFSNYAPIDTDTVQESIITAIHVPTSKVTLNLALDYIVGDIVIYKAIPCSLTYSPLTMGDPLGIKHVREATMMFANKAFTKAQMNFSTDLLPETIPVDFPGDGNGLFGLANFGSGFFGGGSNSAPFRTFIPRQCQRCRYLNVGFIHNTAREQFAIYGITLTGEVGQSTRAYR